MSKQDNRKGKGKGQLFIIAADLASAQPIGAATPAAQHEAKQEKRVVRSKQPYKYTDDSGRPMVAFVVQQGKSLEVHHYPDAHKLVNVWLAHPDYDGDAQKLQVGLFAVLKPYSRRGEALAFGYERPTVQRVYDLLTARLTRAEAQAKQQAAADLASAVEAAAIEADVEVSESEQTTPPSAGDEVVEAA